jgi:Tol biopolymer transport system component
MMKPERWRQVDQLFQAALERAPEDRAAFISEACGEDGSLRHEVEALLAADGETKGFIEAPAYAVAAPLIVGGDTQSLLGKTVGHYQIISLLGKGGMGEVYRARDTRLGRDVAIKVLPREYSVDADRLRRLEQEARAAGALNHPNVLTIYDIGMRENAPYIVSELLIGEPLRERMRGKALPLRRAVDYAIQIARGLAAAHEKGIVHRDLKPENLFLTKDGRLKILDFGLAKLRQPLPGGVVDTDAPTYPPRTAPGVVMGTVGYMSPEQVRAEDVDHRSDIFAFGTILYEMLCGRRAFPGNSAVEVMNAILKEEPAESAELGGEVPSSLQRVMRHCLEKNPAERFQSINDVAFYLEGISGVSDSTSAPQARVSGQTRGYERFSQGLGWIVAAVFLLAAIALFVYLRPAPAEVKAVRFAVSPPEKATSVQAPTISPDGRRLAFTATVEGKKLLWVRPLDSLAAQPLPGTEGASFPFWSPTGEFIGFFAQGKLKRIALSGGPTTTLCDAPVGVGGAWNRDGVILFSPLLATGVHRVPAAGGSVAVVTTSDQLRNSHRWPSFLPDERHFLYSVGFSSQLEAMGIYLASLDGQESTRLVSADSSAVYAASERGGYLLFVREGTLLAQPFDAAEGRLSGEPVRLADQVRGNINRSERARAFSVSENGVLVYHAGERGERFQLGWFDRAGKSLGMIGSAGGYITGASLSPDEKRVAMAREDLQTRTDDIWLLDLARGADSRFTFDPATDHAPVWAPDGSRIVWNSNREGLANLYQKASSGAGQDELLLKADNWKWANDWSRDGRFIVYGENNPKTKGDLWILPVDGERKPFPYRQTPFDERNARFSPDSKWIAYSSDESGGSEVYVQDFPTAGGKWRISTRGGDNPNWRRDGKEIFYVADGKLMVVEVKSGAKFEASVPRALFDLRSIKWVGGNNYAVTGDGQRFLVVTSPEEANASPFTVVLNWMAELKR